jgi:hypothetical protein
MIGAYMVEALKIHHYPFKNRKFYYVRTYTVYCALMSNFAMYVFSSKWNKWYCIVLSKQIKDKISW